MTSIFHSFLVFLLVFTIHHLACGQRIGIAPDSLKELVNDTIQVDKVFIIGYKKTKEHIISRELSVHDGQLITRADLASVLEADKRKLINTKLFLSVDISMVDLSNGKVDVIIRVSERWYFFPIPIFNLADRNFTEWWVNQDADLTRVDWGIKLRHFNFRGRREILNLTAQFGYTKLFRLSYQFPYIDRNQKIGLSFYSDYATNKNIAYKTMRHRQQFLDSDTQLRDKWQSGIYVGYRPNFYSSHSFGVHYSSTTISDSVLLENPRYLWNAKTNQSYFALSYSFVWDFRDFVSYPLTGAYFRLSVDKVGLGLYNDVDILKANVRYARYIDLGKKFYFASAIIGNASTFTKVPYYNYDGVGYGRDFLRGYERYIIEGQHYALHKNSLKRRLFSFETDISNVIRARQFDKIPFSGYLSLNFDQGYVSNYPGYKENNLFTDKYIYGGGVGIDIISFYDFVMRWEYSINIEGERALYFNLFAAF